MLLRAEREHRLALGIGSGGSGAEFSSKGEAFSIRGSGTGDSADMSREAAGSKWVEDDAGANKLPWKSPSSRELLFEVLLLLLGLRKLGFGERSLVPCAIFVLRCVKMKESHFF